MASVRNYVGVLLVLLAFLFFAAPAWADVDLNIKKDDNPETTQVGGLIAYTLTVKNPSTTEDATNVTVKDVLPDEVTFDSATATQGGTDACKEKDGTVTCKLGTLKRTETATVTILVEADEAGSAVNTATVASDTNETDPADNKATVTTEINNRGERRFDRRFDRDRFDRFPPGFLPRDFFDEDEDFFNDEDIDEDDDIDQDDELADAEADLDGETTDEDAFGDDLDDGPVSATAEDGQAEASTPGAVASAGGDPDELEPLTSVPEGVEDEIPTSGPLPNTGGMPMVYWLLPLAGLMMLAGLPVYRWIKSR